MSIHTERLVAWITAWAAEADARDAAQSAAWIAEDAARAAWETAREVAQKVARKTVDENTELIWKSWCIEWNVAREAEVAAWVVYEAARDATRVAYIGLRKGFGGQSDAP